MILQIADLKIKSKDNKKNVIKAALIKVVKLLDELNIFFIFLMKKNIIPIFKIHKNKT